MSYEEIQPAFYQMNFPQGPWHAGARGWTKSPWVTWGDNPAQAGPHMLAVHGLGVLGADAATAVPGSGDAAVLNAAAAAQAAKSAAASAPFVVTPGMALLAIGGLAVAGAFVWYQFGHVKRFHRK